MLLGPSGQNIYPEEIESVLNNKYCVMESLVIEDNGKLIALIYPDNDTIQAQKISEKELNHIMEHNRKELNHQLPAFMNVARFVMHPQEFEKTPKRSIKRFLYDAKNLDL
jgi:long-chain acyl-CoA synthetase